MSLSLGQQHQAFIEIYETYRDRLYSYILYRVGYDQAVAEDVTSQVFLKAYQAHDPNQQQTVGPWLFAIARNTLIDYYRSRKPTETLDEMGDTMALADEATPEVLFTEQYETERLKEALATLPETDRAYVEAHFFERQTSAQIAEVHATTAPAVRKRISRALEKLRSVLIACLVLFFV